MQKRREIRRARSLTLPLAVTGLAAFSCTPHERPMADPEVIAAWERSMRDDAGPVPAPSTADPEVPSTEVTPSGELAGEASGTNLGSAVDCGADAGVCEPDGGVSVACPGCLIDGECIGDAVINDGNPCQVCDPARDAGAWSLNDGATCDDGLYCTESDACSGTLCTGQPRECEDGVTCNGVSTCEEASGSCTAATNECGGNALCDVLSDTCVSTCEGCVVAGVCVPSGREATGNPCLVCNPTLSTTTFSPAPGKTCGAAASTCSQQDTCDGQGACQPNHLPAASPCGGTSSSSCDQTDSCDGAGRCLQRLAPNGTQCDDGAFCTVGDQCQGGQCVAGGNRNCGANRACDEASNQCNCLGCTVAGTCFSLGALNPANACQICDPGRSQTQFSINTAECDRNVGADCTSNQQCASGRCDTWFRDLDADGHGDPANTRRLCNNALSSFAVATFVLNNDDCCDLGGTAATAAAQIFSGQTEFFFRPQTVCPSVGEFDYNCSRNIEYIYQEDTERYDGFCGNVPSSECAGTKLWIAATNPGCGLNFAVRVDECGLDGTTCRPFLDVGAGLNPQGRTELNRCH